MSEQNMPQVASIEQQRTTLPSTSDVIRQAMPPVNVPSATITQHQSSPTLPFRPEYNPIQMQQPMSDTVQDKKIARIHNNFASISNAVGQFNKNMQDKKQADLTHDINKVMLSQQNIDNAQSIIDDKNAILKNNNATAEEKTSAQADLKNATGVLESNKGLLDRVFQGKNSKSIMKAFDVSFTDQKKNETPEVKAMIAAKQQFEASKASGLNVNNAQEKRVQDQANQGAGIGSQAPPKQEQHRMITQGSNPTFSSNNRLADQFMQQQTLSLASNPSYAAAVKQQEENQKTAGKIATTLISAGAAGERNQNTQLHDDARANATNQTRALLEANREKNAVKIAGMHDATSRANQKDRDISSMSRLVEAVKGRSAQAVSKNMSPENKAKIFTGNIKILEDTVTKATNNIDTMMLQLNRFRKEKNPQTDSIKRLEDSTQRQRQIITDAEKHMDEAGAQLRALEAGGVKIYDQPDSKQPIKLESPTTDGDSNGGDENASINVEDI